MKYILVEDIRLNPQNPRHTPVLLEEEALDILCSDEKDMISLCESIFNNGYYEQYVISVLKRDDDYIALDGNRRIAAIKLLSQSVDFDYSNNKFKLLRKYLSNHKTVIKRVPCTVYNEESEAASYLYMRHTSGNDVKMWGILEQYNFKKKYNLEYDVVYEFLLNYFDRSQLKSISTIKRVFNNSDVAEYLELDKTGKIRNEDKLKKAKKIVKEISKGYVNSRTLNNADNIKKYFSEVSGHSTENPPKKSTVKSNKNRGKLILHSKNYLLPDHKSFITEKPKINAIIDELTRLNFNSFTYSAIVLFRVFIEHSIYYFSLKQSLWQYKNQTLHKSLIELNDLFFSNNGLNPNKGNHYQLKKVLEKNGKYVTILQSIMHDLDVDINKELLYDFRNSIMPLIIQLYQYREI